MRIAHDLQTFGKGHCLQTQNLILFLYPPLLFVAVHAQLEVFTSQLHDFTFRLGQTLQGTEVLFGAVAPTSAVLGKDLLQFFLQMINLSLQDSSSLIMLFAEIYKFELCLSTFANGAFTVTTATHSRPVRALLLLLLLGHPNGLAHRHHISISLPVFFQSALHSLALLQHLEVLLPLGIQGSFGGIESCLKLIGSMSRSIQFLLQSVFIACGGLELFVVKCPLCSLIIEAVDFSSIVPHKGIQVLLAGECQTHEFLHGCDFAQRHALNYYNYASSPTAIIQMRREYTMTSPEQLYPDRERVRSPYLSPKNNPNNQQAVYSSFKSPSHRPEDNFEKKYPTSSKYNPYEHAEYRPQPQYHSPEPSQAIEISELRLTISQLRSSLQTTTQNSQRLQEELFMQRSKNVELSEVRRRLQEQLSRMQFQLDRIGNYDALETRQTNIKLTNALRENTRLSQQVADLIDQMKVLKNEQRRLMSECDTLLKEKQVLMGQNQSLLQKLQLLEGEVRQVKQEVAIHSQQSIRLNQNALPSRVNNLHTVRTYQASTINNSPRPIPTMHSRHSIDLEQLPEQIDYQAENERLQRDYQRLLEENQSMKDLYNNLHQPESKPTPIPQMNMQTFSNKAIAQQLSSQRDGHKNENNKGIMLKTMQKRELKLEMDEVRDEALGELTKIYNRAVEKANSQRKNCLKVFIHQLVKNKQIYAQMAENYLKLRMTIMEETGLKLPEKYEEGAIIGQREKMVLQMYKSVKDKSKSQKEVGTALAVFRLITLMVKAGGITPILSDNIKHSILKYVYKLAQNQRITTEP